MEPRFRPALFKFLKDLKANNDRDWFKANKDRYEEVLRGPAVAVVEALAPKLAKVAPHVVIDPRPSGGALSRIHRDTRFSKDKSPYQTYVGMRFPHEQAKQAPAPGYYLHLGLDGCFFCSGTYQPEPKDAARIRAAIAKDPQGWKRALGGKAFREAGFELTGDSLKRVPKEFDPEHPLADDLRRKDFFAMAPLTRAQVQSADLVAQVVSLARAGAPLSRYLAGVVGVPW